MARNSACSSSHTPADVKKHSTSHSAECTGLRLMMTHSAAATRIAAKAQKSAVWKLIGGSAIFGVFRAIRGNLRLVAVADRKQHVLGVIKITAPFAVVLQDPRLDDRIDRTGLFAETAENALGQIDVVARGAAGS